MIKQLSQQTAEQLCAQQVITSLPDCVKQLIDNAIDAKATYVKVVLQQYGKAKIEVIDNGMGIDSFDFLGKKGTTSKNKLNQRFDYLGFRGEAVHSIARVSGDMEIESKCAKDGHRRKFNLVTSAYFQSKEERLCHGQFNFQLPNREGSRNTGTKVTIGNIFQRLPVRQIELSCKCREFLRKTNDLIKEYCLIYPEIQFMLINSREGREEVIIQTAAQKRFDRGGWLERIRELDERVAQSLLYVCGAEYEGYVLDKIESGSSKENRFLKKNYHYLFLNRRPIDPVPPILTAFNDIYRKYNHSTKYAFIINLKLDHQEIDVNLTPNKREVFIRKNVLDRIVQALRQEIVSKVVEEITTLSSPQDGKKTAKSEPAVLAEISKVHPLNPRKTIFLPTQAPEEPKNRSQVSKSEKTHEGKPGLQFQNYPKAQGSHSQQLNKPAKNGIDMSELPKISVDRNKLKLQLNSKLSASFLGLRRTSENPFTLGSGLERSSLREVEEPQIRRKTPQEKLREEQQDAKRRADFMQEMKQVKIEQNEQELNKIKISTASKRTFPQKGSLMEQEVRRRESAEAESEHEVSAETNQHERGRSSWIATMPRGNHDVELQNRIKSKLNVDMSQIFTKFNQARQPTPNPTEQERTDTLKEDGHYHTANAGTLQADAQRVEQMQGTGEIQQGQQQIKEVHFDSKGKDEESINQELCAELGELAPKSVKKHHFQHFQVIGQFNKGFIITAFNRKFYMVDQHASDQKYHYQKNLQKSSDLECINCFDQKEITPIDCDEIEQAKHFLQQVGFSYCIEGRKLLKLLRCPLFKGRKLGLEYFDLIVAEKKELAKVSKFAAMCAMSACREATKVGEVLGRQEMRASVLKLSGLASPWNCPHGRPTLIDLGAVEKLKNGIRLEKEYLI